MPETRITLATLALLFSAISLLMLAFLHQPVSGPGEPGARPPRCLQEKPDEVLYGQIRNLRTRLDLIRWMPLFGIASLLLCVFSMFLIYVGPIGAAEVVFGPGVRRRVRRDCGVLQSLPSWIDSPESWPPGCARSADASVCRSASSRS